MTESALRKQVSDVCRALHARGWAAYHEGNVSVRLGGGRLLATPTATSKGDVTPESLLVLDEAGALVSGRGKPFSEIGLHLCVYRARPEVNAVVHAHPPAATGFALAGRGLDRPLLPEAVVALGRGIPTVPLAAPGKAAVEALAPFAARHDAVLLASHGAIAWGRDLEYAALRMELVEQVARTALVAEQIGGARELPAAMVDELLRAREKAGLGAATGAATGAPAATVIPSPPSDLARVIRDEVVKALKTAGG